MIPQKIPTIKHETQFIMTKKNVKKKLHHTIIFMFHFDEQKF